MQETWAQSLALEDPLEKEMATHSSILAWEIPWTEKPGGLQAMGLQRVGNDWVTEHAYVGRGQGCCKTSCTGQLPATKYLAQNVNCDTPEKSRNRYEMPAKRWARIHGCPWPPKGKVCIPVWRLCVEFPLAWFAVIYLERRCGWTQGPAGKGLQVEHTASPPCQVDLKDPPYCDDQ